MQTLFHFYTLMIGSSYSLSDHNKQIKCLSFQEKTCEETVSFDLTSFDIASCIEDVAQCIEFIECREHNELQDTNEAAGKHLIQVCK